MNIAGYKRTLTDTQMSNMCDMAWPQLQTLLKIMKFVVNVVYKKFTVHFMYWLILKVCSANLSEHLVKAQNSTISLFSKHQQFNNNFHDRAIITVYLHLLVNRRICRKKIYA